MADPGSLGGPVVADVDGDGQGEIVAGGEQLTVLGGDGVPLPRVRSIWNQHSYHVTNVELDGSLPVVEPPSWLTRGLGNYRENGFLPDETAALDTFTYEVSDGRDTDTATVYVETLPVENIPEIVCDPNATAVAGVAYSSRVCGVDADLFDTLTYALAPGGPTIDPDTGIVTWTPTSADIGTETYTATVTDQTGRFTTSTFDIEVIASVTVPTVVGETDADADTAIGAAGLTVGDVTRRFDAIVAAGEVIEQWPLGASVARPGDEVDYVLSDGPSAADLDEDMDGFSPNEGDCDDSDPDRFPGAPETVNDGVDSDCDGLDQAQSPVVSLEASDPNPSVLVGRIEWISVTATFEDGRTLDVTRSSQWSSGDATILLTNSLGQLGGLNAGQTDAIIRYRGVELLVPVTVEELIDDQIAPVATITSPEPGEEISAEVDIVGTAADANLTGWTLNAVAEDGSLLAEIAVGHRSRRRRCARHAGDGEGPRWCRHVASRRRGRRRQRQPRRRSRDRAGRAAARTVLAVVHRPDDSRVRDPDLRDPDLRQPRPSRR